MPLGYAIVKHVSGTKKNSYEVIPITWIRGCTDIFEEDTDDESYIIEFKNKKRPARRWEMTDAKIITAGGKFNIQKDAYLIVKIVSKRYNFYD